MLEQLSINIQVDHFLGELYSWRKIIIPVVCNPGPVNEYSKTDETSYSLDEDLIISP